jgi:hypothetical protein
MPATYEPIATTTLASAVTNFTFSSIPQTYTDLRVVIMAMTASQDSYWIQMNDNSYNQYSNRSMYGVTGNTKGSNSATGQPQFNPANSIRTVSTIFTMDLFDYASNAKFKTVLFASGAQENSSDGYLGFAVGTMRDYSGVSSIKIFNTGPTNFSIGTQATVYGIKKA